jgi:hypothetical protein
LNWHRLLGRQRHYHYATSALDTTIDFSYH